ncbi:DUF2971 domain-containing protein [Catenovulum sp. 2E275]|uniref:DUF2971 domain-containing protein n=1 Tax=Catenovulum sp. 2E275 TaxID=2980497 RepID=UPI0021D385DE|nr:DUF2971 domain-containing protein [Catenovulum sp. 2E275]MCU4677709.1 DUF2971 domain-containing protein [Catenovulum sp. 2E275]
MSTIYHYCGINAFFNIIRNKKLWVSAANNLNDYKEVDWFIDKARNKLSQAVRPENQDYLNEFWLHRSVNSPMPYICSFSKNGDLLSQWRAYADDGSGLAIGFNREYFGFDSKMPTPNVSSKQSVGLADVIYDEKYQDRIVDTLVGTVGTPTESDDEKYNRFANAAVLINQFSYICKNSAFKEEDEVRIVHTPVIFGNDNGGTRVLGGISDLQHRVSGEYITSYFELDFAEDRAAEALVEVILGPKCKISRFDIETFLSVSGFGQVKYKMSNASYR